MMLSHRFRIAFLALGILLSVAGFSYVAGAPGTAHASNASIGGLFTSEGNCAQISRASGALMGLIVPCITNSVEQATIRLAAGFSNMMMPIFYAFLTLVVTFFGVKVVQGEAQVGKEAFFLLLKVGFVIVFVNNFAGLTPYVYAVVEEGQEIVASAVAPRTLYSAGTNAGPVNVTVTVTQQNSNAVHCDAAQYRPDGAGGVVWAHMDCLLGKIFGFAFGSGDQHNMVLGASVLGMVSGFFFGGTFGLAIFFAIIGFLWSIFSFVLKVGFAFLNGYIIAAIYIIISPLFIPLVLLKPTAQYFDKWWRGLVAAMLMPVIVTGYAIFAMLVYDKMLLAPDSMVNKLFDRDIFQSATMPNKCSSIFGAQSNNSIAALADTGITREQMGMLPSLLGSVSDVFVGAENPTVCVRDVEFEEYAPPGVTEQEFFTDIFVEMATLLILAIIMQSGLKEVVKMMGMITGKASVGAALSPQEGLEQNLASSGQAFKTGITGAMGAPLTQAERDAGYTDRDVGAAGATGTLFLERIPGAIADGAQGFGRNVSGS